MDTTDPDIQELNEKMDELTEMVKENRRMIRSVYRSVRLNSLISVIKWVIIIAVTVGSLYILQPYIDFVKQTYQTFGGFVSHMSTTTQATSSAPSFDRMGLINKF